MLNFESYTHMLEMETNNVITILSRQQLTCLKVVLQL